ncbi:hypothetical protein IFM89_004355 [Coptis chinensis]|uniref:Small nuclear ribonucleoprotein E n=1 Tax=Coptis chinensis TaxID=261450 RepID=A0A835M3S5_9MAGN|nr:hypothetical protein IFM89_004355 [Coptis chinensis]
MATTRVQRIMTQPINLIFRFLQSKARIQIWLFQQKDVRIEGRIIESSEFRKIRSYALPRESQNEWIEKVAFNHLFSFTIHLHNHRDCVSVKLSLGFDEYMNLVLDDAEEVNIKKKTRSSLGRILLKGDNITLMQNTGK